MSESRAYDEPPGPASTRPPTHDAWPAVGGYVPTRALPDASHPGSQTADVRLPASPDTPRVAGWPDEPWRAAQPGPWGYDARDVRAATADAATIPPAPGTAIQYGWPDGSASWGVPSSSRPAANERQWAAAAHWLPLLSHWIGPLVVLLTAGRRSEHVRTEAVASLNWEITVALLLALAVALAPIGVLGPALAVAVVALSVALHVIGAIQAARGGSFTYPLALPIVR